MGKQEICSVIQTICCVVCDKNLQKNCRYLAASTRKCSLWNNDWNSHLIIIVICPHTVNTVVTDKRFKVSLTAKDPGNYSVYQKKGEACSREHGQRRIFSHTRLLQEACHLLQDVKLECTLSIYLSQHEAFTSETSVSSTRVNHVLVHHEWMCSQMIPRSSTPVLNLEREMLQGNPNACAMVRSA